VTIANRTMSVRIPIDFEAQQYEITGRTRRSDTGAIMKVFQDTVTLCKVAPGTADCLERPVFQPGVAVTRSATLEPGSYVFEATVKDRRDHAEDLYGELLRGVVPRARARGYPLALRGRCGATGRCATKRLLRLGKHEPLGF